MPRTLVIPLNYLRALTSFALQFAAGVLVVTSTGSAIAEGVGAAYRFISGNTSEVPRKVRKLLPRPVYRSSGEAWSNGRCWVASVIFFAGASVIMPSLDDWQSGLRRRRGQGGKYQFTTIRVNAVPPRGWRQATLDDVENNAPQVEKDMEAWSHAALAGGEVVDGAGHGWGHGCRVHAAVDSPTRGAHAGSQVSQQLITRLPVRV